MIDESRDSIIFKRGCTKEEVAQDGHLGNPRVTRIATIDRGEEEIVEQINHLEGITDDLNFRSEDSEHAVVRKFELDWDSIDTFDTEPGTEIGVSRPAKGGKPTRERVDIRELNVSEPVRNSAGGKEDTTKSVIVNVFFISLRRKDIFQESQRLRLV